MCPSHTPEKSGAWSAAWGVEAAWASDAFLSFAAVDAFCALNTGERARIATETKIEAIMRLCMSAIPPLIRIGSNYHETRSLGDPAKIRSVALNKFGKPPVHCYWPGSGGGPRGMTSPFVYVIFRRFSTFRPFLAGLPVTVISSPGLSFFPLHP